MEILFLILLFMISILSVIYFGYLGILKIISSIQHKKMLIPSKIKSVSIIIATYNEATVIRSKLDALLTINKPADTFEIIVVDSASTDDTRKIVSEYVGKGIILLTQDKRMGKANALNYALSKTSGEVIIISDANSIFSSDSLAKMIKQFDEKTGAVLPRFMPSGKKSVWDTFFYAFHHSYKLLESNADSVFIVFGELFAFRKALIDHIYDHAVADDLEVAITVRRKDFRIKYSPEITVYEKIPDNKKEIRIQKVRHSLGILQVMTRNSDLFLNTKYGTYGLLIFPIHVIQMTIGPILCFLTLGLLLIELVRVAIIAFTPLFLFLFTGALVFALLALNYSSSKVRHIFSSIYDVVALQAYILIALFKLLKNSDDFVWEKISSTR